MRWSPRGYGIERGSPVGAIDFAIGIIGRIPIDFVSIVFTKYIYTPNVFGICLTGQIRTDFASEA